MASGRWRSNASFWNSGNTAVMTFGAFLALGHAALPRPRGDNLRSDVSTAALTAHYCARARDQYCNKCDFSLHHALLHAWVADTDDDQTGNVFIVGCNDGSDIERLISQPWYSPRLRVFAWEMQEPVLEAAKRLLASHNNSVEVLHGGVSDHSSSVCMRQGGEGSYINDRPRAKCAATCCGGTRVHVQAWSHFADARGISEVVFAVVDVEGHEASVIRGMSLETRSAAFPVFTFELGASWINFKNSGNWTQQETASYLARLGYELFLVGSIGCGPSRCTNMPGAFKPALLPIKAHFFGAPDCRRKQKHAGAAAPRPWLVRGSALDGNALAVLASARRRMRWLDVFLRKHVVEPSSSLRPWEPRPRTP